jgi:hypothetical protein
MTKMKYDSLTAFYTAKQAVRDERDRHAESVALRWSLLKNDEVRSTLFKNAAVDMVRGTAVGRQVHELLNGRFSGPLISGLGMAFASTRAGVGKRMLFSGISLALGKMFGAQNADPDAPGMLTKLAEGIGSIVRTIRERKAGRNGQDVEPDPWMHEDEPIAR